MSQYETRNARDLDKSGRYYSRHVEAMTRERLHSKSAIAAELAHRDRSLDKAHLDVVELKHRLTQIELWLRSNKHSFPEQWNDWFNPHKIP